MFSDDDDREKYYARRKAHKMLRSNVCLHKGNKRVEGNKIRCAIEGCGKVVGFVRKPKKEGL